MPAVELRKYSGKCTLDFDIGVKLETPFELTVDSDGSIRVVCRVRNFTKDVERLLNEFGRRPVKSKLTGTIEAPSKGEIRASSLYVESFHIGPTNEIKLRAFSPVKISFTSIADSDPAELHFGLTNLVFSGCEWSKQDNLMIRDKFRASIEDRQILFKQLQSHKNIVETLKKTKGVLVTSEAISSSQFKGVRDFESTINDVLVLLSFATGNWISWVYLDIYKGQTLAQTKLSPSKTMPYLHREMVIDSDHIGSCDLKDFLEKTWNRYNEYKEDLGLNIVMEYCVTSKVSGIHLEVKFLLASITFECLTSYLSSYFANKGETPDLSTFKNRILALFEEFNVTHDERELDFIGLRDKIVHTGRFPKGTEGLKEYLGLMNLIDRTILTILGYKGEKYLNISKKFRKETLN